MPYLGVVDLGVVVYYYRPQQPQAINQGGFSPSLLGYAPMLYTLPYQAPIMPLLYDSACPTNLRSNFRFRVRSTRTLNSYLTMISQLQLQINHVASCHMANLQLQLQKNGKYQSQTHSEIAIGNFGAYYNSIMPALRVTYQAQNYAGIIYMSLP